MNPEGNSSQAQRLLQNFLKPPLFRRGRWGGDGTCAVSCAALHRTAPCQGSHTPMFKAERYVKPPPLHRLTAPDAVSLPGPLKLRASVLIPSAERPLCDTGLPVAKQRPSPLSDCSILAPHKGKKPFVRPLHSPGAAALLQDGLLHCDQEQSQILSHQPGGLLLHT
ncbi:hypothetical protein NQZ68_040626 [Dissostichus eleginoides]|nr:hypothetical protein NQZ68_040626 [Dissostichus eleginoides]